MHIGGSPTLGSDAFGEYSSIMKEPLSALCYFEQMTVLEEHRPAGVIS